MEYLEKEMGWREEDFDFVLQSLRTVLLKRTNPGQERLLKVGLLYTEQTERLLYTPAPPHLTICRHSSMRVSGLSPCSITRL